VKRRKILSLFGLTVASGFVAIACSSNTVTPQAENTATSGSEPTVASAPAEGGLVIYSGRSEKLVGELIEKFETQTGVEVEIRYGDTAELAAAILEEQQNSPADLFFAQDAGALGALQKAERTTAIPQELLSKVDERYRSPEGEWVGVTGRVRTVDYNTDLVQPEELPASIMDLTDPKWEGKIGWAPTNGSFQSFVTALRLSEGEEAARQWLEGIKANNPQVYPKNTPIVEALSRGEIAVGFVNHYYLERLKAENPDVPVGHHYTNDVGSLVNVAGVAILDSAKNPEAAQKFIGFLLDEDAQKYFATETYEYPLVSGIEAAKDLKPLAEIDYKTIDLSNLDDLDATLKLLQDSGVL
jgi:iron(III) transport system substrate-binding protein